MNLVTSVPIQSWGGFDTIPRTRWRCKQSDALQPCKLYFGELRTGGLAGRQRGGGQEEKRRKGARKKGVKSDNPSRWEKECRGDRLPPPWIQRCPVMSSRLILYAATGVPARTGSGSKAARRKKKAKKHALRGALAILL